MISGKLSVIIPFAQEYPQVAFTVQAIYCELRDKCDFEIIVIDNHCDELQSQLDIKQEKRDQGGEYLSNLSNSSRPWLKYITYDKKLSHWQSKNAGVSISTGEFLWFCDSHCVLSQGSLIDMFSYYKISYATLHGSLSMPLSYMLEKPGLELIYKLITDIPKGIIHYSFTRYMDSNLPYAVPCMSTCGMMLSRSIYDKFGGWPEELGIYGGGENFFNFTMAVIGFSINIFPTKPLYHYAAPRGYSWNYNDYHRNRCIATYMFGGEILANRYIQNIKGSDSIKESIFSSIIGSKSCIEHRQYIKDNQMKTISSWLKERNIVSDIE